MRKMLRYIFVTLLVLISAVYLVVEGRSNRSFDAPYPDIKASKDSNSVARGRELVFGPAHCANCHTPASTEALVESGEEAPLSGGRVFDLPIGKLYAKNITPDSTGIGAMTDAEFARALRYGLRKNGQALFDFMPFHNTSDEDISAILSFLRSQPPVNNKVPENEMNLIGRAVKAFVMKPVGPTGDVPVAVTRDTSIAYGKYIANNVANCRGCHTNRDLMTGAFIGPDYAGGLAFDDETDSGTYTLTTPNLTPDITGRITGWTQEQFIQRFRTGKLIQQSHMPWGPFSRMSDNDLKAIYNFLQTIPPIANKVPHGPQKKD